MAGLTCKGMDLSESVWWPDRIAAKKSLIGEMHGNKIAVGKEGQLVRVQNGNCIIDFGHNGVFAIALEQTDLVARIAENKRNNNKNSISFPFRWIKSFYIPQAKRPCQLVDYLEYEKFLLVFYPLEKLEEVIKFSVERHDELIKAQSACILLIPVTEPTLEQVLALAEAGVVSPNIVGGHRYSFIKSMHFETPEEAIQAHLINWNGRVLQSFTGLGGDFFF